ncbi:nuclear transport factor 2 family protein [Dactylosporangium sp. CA-092794]|uniref:nuclear transport factor 2 family protein n=1 Tax=Dactylosporangium sp. CA-092794 TaxID=3239929 RepID=UPI003D90EB0A
MPVDLDVREALLTTVTALWFDIDHRNGANAAGFFTPDAELRFSAASFRGTAAIEDVYANRAARGPRVSRHIVTNLHVIEHRLHRARAVSVLLLFAEDGEAPRPSTAPTLIADVYDQFEHRDGRWLIDSRRIENLFIDPATQLAVPTK